jgi:hypothetical protein
MLKMKRLTHKGECGKFSFALNLMKFKYIFKISTN